MYKVEPVILGTISVLAQIPASGEKDEPESRMFAITVIEDQRMKTSGDDAADVFLALLNGVALMGIVRCDSYTWSTCFSCLSIRVSSITLMISKQNLMRLKTK